MGYGSNTKFAPLFVHYELTAVLILTRYRMKNQFCSKNSSLKFTKHTRSWARVKAV